MPFDRLPELRRRGRPGNSRKRLHELMLSIVQVTDFIEHEVVEAVVISHDATPLGERSRVLRCQSVGGLADAPYWHVDAIIFTLVTSKTGTSVIPAVVAPAVVVPAAVPAVGFVAGFPATTLPVTSTL